ncbi:MAG: RNA 2',3'-cyclic phosphodiesterase [Sedimentisphaerales bacterium]|nr:RNA 2',3'-cyclic phosphodiesterase [Sedimentisphaerales bacterium]
MRVFIAINIDEQIRKAVGRLQNEIRNKSDIKKGDVKWVNPDVMHLTLKFLGEIRDAQSVDVCNITKEVAGRHKNFELEVEKVGYFGGRSAKVLWIGTGQNSENLLQLQDDLEQDLASADWPRETRKFTGHLTLCRVRNSKAGVKLAQMTEEYKNLKLGTVPVDAISVYQSQLTPKGPIYTVLGNYKLQ